MHPAEPGKPSPNSVGQCPPQPRHLRVLHALHCQLIQLQLSWLQGFTLLKQRLIKGDAGWDIRCGPVERQCPVREQVSSSGTQQGARRGLPILSQEAVVLGLRLDAGSGCSHLLVNSHHLILHQAANLQVFLQDFLPTTRQDPWSAGPQAWARLGSLGVPDSGLGVSCGVEPPPYHLPAK